MNNVVSARYLGNAEKINHSLARSKISLIPIISHNSAFYPHWTSSHSIHISWLSRRANSYDRRQVRINLGMILMAKLLWFRKSFPIGGMPAEYVGCLLCTDHLGFPYDYRTLVAALGFSCSTLVPRCFRVRWSSHLVDTSEWNMSSGLHQTPEEWNRS